MAKRRKVKTSKRRKRETAGWVVIQNGFVLEWDEQEQWLDRGTPGTLFRTRRRAQRAIDRERSTGWIDPSAIIVRLEPEMPDG